MTLEAVRRGFLQEIRADCDLVKKNRPQLNVGPRLKASQVPGIVSETIRGLRTKVIVLLFFMLGNDHAYQGPLSAEKKTDDMYDLP